MCKEEVLSNSFIIHNYSQACKIGILGRGYFSSPNAKSEVIQGPIDLWGFKST